MCLLPDQVTHVKGNPCDCKNTEKTEKNFSVLTRQIHAECHPVIFGKMKDKPVTNHRDFLTYPHIGFDQYLEKLIEGQD